MSTIDLPPVLEPAIPPVPVRRFTVEEFLQMFESGLLPDAEHSELLEGWIVTKMVKNPPHEVALVLTQRELNSVIPAGFHLRNQASTRTGDSVPEPDLSVTRGDPRDHLKGHPTSGDTPLVVEISDTSLRQDRTIKARVYARAGISVYWIVNIIDSQVEVYSDPTGPDPSPCYRACVVYRDLDAVPVVIEGQEIGRIVAKEILP